MNKVQARAAHLCFRCYTGFDKMDKEKKHPIDHDQAMVEWTAFLSKRVKHGGAKFVFEICRIVKEKQTPKGLDLGDRPALLEKLANWATEKSKSLVEAAACCIFKYLSLIHI